MAPATFHGTDIPVLGLGGDKPVDLRQAALELLINQPYSSEVWQAAENRVLDLVTRRSEAASSEGLVQLAARAPLPSVRERLRQIASDTSDPDSVTARESLSQVGENHFANLLIEDLGRVSNIDEIACSLAKSPLDRMRIRTPALEARTKTLNLDDPAESSAYVWASIALAKKGRFKYLNRVLSNLEEGWKPGLFSGNPYAVRDDIQAAAFDSERLLRYAEKKFAGLTSDERECIVNDEAFADPKLSVIDALLKQPSVDRVATTPTNTLPAEELAALFSNDALRATLERNLTAAIEREWYHDIAPNALRDLTANLPEIGARLENEYLPTLIGNELVELTSRLPQFEPDGPGIIRAYSDFLRRTGNRSVDFEVQLGWMLAQGNFEELLHECEGLLGSDDDLEQSVAWSLTSKGSVFAKGQPPPFFGAGGSGGLPSWARTGASRAARSSVRYKAARPASDYPVLADTGGGSAASYDRGELEEAGPPGDEGGDLEQAAEPADAGEFGDDPPRSAYALLNCPDEVEPMVEFVVTVGLDKNPTPGVIGGELHRPDSSVGNYKLTVTLLYDGFMLRTGEHSEFTLDVSVNNPFPKRDLHLTAVAGDRFKSSRVLLAQYSIDGQFIGSAARTITVGASAVADVSSDLSRGFDLSMPPGVPTPDMTISIVKGNTVGDDRLVWNVITPHDSIDVTLPQNESSYKSDIGSAPDQWARDLMNAINANPVDNPLGPMMIGNGREIRQQIPVWVRRKLRELAQLIDDSNHSATVFIVSDEPNIPWELAYLRLDRPGQAEDFLGSAFVVGRWVRGYEDVDGNQVPAYPPPTEVTVGTMAVVSGDYSRTKNWNALNGAEEEASQLALTYRAGTVNADSQLATWLSGAADVDAIHFAVHGKWSVGGGQDGIVLVDGTMLTPKEVLGATLGRKPFVFLNACQLGQGEKTLGDYGGIAAAFLEAGASGVVAALWNVDDTEAKKLALEFYRQAKASGAGPGEVFRRQRATFQKDTRSKLSLAYQFFGHPNMRIKLNLP